MNLTNELQSVDLTNPTRVKSVRGPDAVSDTVDDTFIAQVISAVSEQFCRHVGVHGLQAARTEVYRIRKFAKFVTLDAKPITTLTSIKYASHGDFDDVTTQSTDDYILNAPEGTVDLLFDTDIERGYLQIAYTGGWGTDATDAISNQPMLAQLCDLQCAHVIARRRSLGGSVSTATGQSATYMGEYGLLKEVAAHLDSIRRGAF